MSPSAAEFSIWTREAGAGGLSIAVEGPSRAEISFDDRKDGSCGVSYVAPEPGTDTKLPKPRAPAPSESDLIVTLSFQGTMRSR